jgi:hypothetical protein
MAKEVSTFHRCFDTSTSQSPLHHVRHTIAREERLKRGNLPKKDAIRRVDRRPTLQIPEDRLSDVLGKRQPYFVASLPDYAQSAGHPINVTYPKLAYVAGAQPEPYEHQDDGSIPQTSRRTAITSSNKPTYLLG